MLGGGHECKRVAGAAIVRSNGGSDGGGKLSNEALRRRGHLRAVESQREDERRDNVEFVLVGLRLAGKSPRHRDGLAEAVIHSRAVEEDANVEVTTKVPDGVSHALSVTNVYSKLAPKFLTSVGAGAVDKTLGRRYPCTHGVKITEGKSISSSKSVGMVRPHGIDHEVIGKASRNGMQRKNPIGPGMQHESHEHHAEGATLRDATRMKVCNSQAPRNGVVEQALTVEGFVRLQGTSRESSKHTELNKEVPVNLIKALVNVGRSPVVFLPSNFATSSWRPKRYQASSAPTGFVVPAKATSDSQVAIQD